MPDPNTQNLAAELAAAEAAIPADPTLPPPPGTPEPPPAAAVDSASCSDLTPGLVEIIAATVLPAWNLTEDEKREFSGALGECLDQLFPGGLSGKYACWLRLVACSAVIVVSRASANGGKLPRIGPRLEKPEKAEAVPAETGPAGA